MSMMRRHAIPLLNGFIKQTHPKATRSTNNVRRNQSWAWRLYKYLITTIPHRLLPFCQPTDPPRYVPRNTQPSFRGFFSPRAESLARGFSWSRPRWPMAPHTPQRCSDLSWERGGWSLGDGGGTIWGGRGRDGMGWGGYGGDLGAIWAGGGGGEDETNPGNSGEKSLINCCRHEVQGF